jgi:hypothetical protein
MEGGSVSLASWFAAPLTVDQAQVSLSEVRQRLRTGRCTPAGAFNIRLGEIVFRFWAGQDVEPDYGNCLAMAEDDRQRAMLELCFGQLLIARKCRSAWLHLDRGFALAAHLLEPEEYFSVLKRHELLRQLPVAPGASEGASLEALLNEARVIARLRGPASRPDLRGPRHRDTVD